MVWNVYKTETYDITPKPALSLVRASPNVLFGNAFLQSRTWKLRCHNTKDGETLRE